MKIASLLLAALVCASTTAIHLQTEMSGEITVMSNTDDAIVGASCEYANEQDGGLDSPAATSPYITNQHYCGADSSVYDEGSGCGSCFNVSYDGSDATDPGVAGWAIVQVVNTGDKFTCHETVFEEITGATTGIFPVTYTPYECETESEGVVTVLDGDNAYYVKAIFSDMPAGVDSAVINVANAEYTMSRNGEGATFVASTNGESGAASFTMTLTDGSNVALEPCFDSWPQPTDASCSPTSSSLPQIA